MPVEPLGHCLEPRRLLAVTVLSGRPLQEGPVAAELLGGAGEREALVHRRHELTQGAEIALDGLRSLDEEADVCGVPEHGVPRLHATKRGNPVQNADLQADRGQDALDDRAVLRREPPRRQEAPAGEGQHHPGEQGKGEE